MILVFGATGFTGRMTVEALARRGLPVRAAARSQDRLEQLGEKFGVEWAIADVNTPETVHAAADGASALVSTVGPYTRFGEVAVEAAIEAGIPYFDCTGEPAFIRRIFEEFGPQASDRGVPLLTTIGYDYTPGTLAGGLALREAGAAATRIDIGYFLTGSPRKRNEESFSTGTLESLEASSGAPRSAWRGGRMIQENGPRQVLEFDVDSAQRTAIEIGASEHFTLPRAYDHLTAVNVGLGWFGEDSTTAGGGSESSSRAATQSERGGPSTETRQKARTYVVAVARDDSDAELARVDVSGPNPYDLTGELLAWAAGEAHRGAINGVGAIGAIEAFGLERLESGCAEVGLTRV